MNQEQGVYLQSLVEAHGAPGFEEAVQRLFRERVAGVCDLVRTDVLGSVIALRSGAGQVRVLLDGHADEIAFLVKYIDDNGYLYLTTSGGWDAEVIVSQRVVVHTRSGPVRGAVGKKAVHLMTADDRKKKSELESLWVDIGAADGAEARECVRIGDPVTMEAGYAELRNGRAVAKSFDNRVGLYAVTETLRSLSPGLAASCYGVSAVQEEIGLRGARAAAYSVDPHVAIAIDVTHGTDYPDVSKKKYGDISLGKGPVLARGANINAKVLQRLIEVAEANGIPYQLEAEGSGTGTDANVIQLVRAGVATGLVSLPLRYMHSSCEMLQMDDLDATVKLLTAFVASLSDDDNWTPG